MAGLTTYKMLNKEKPAAFSELFQQNPNNLLPAAFHATDAQPVDLTQAAESSLHAVVHIRATQLSKTQTVQEQPDIFDFFFGDGRGRQRQIQTDVYKRQPSHPYRSPRATAVIFFYVTLPSRTAFC